LRENFKFEGFVVLSRERNEVPREWNFRSRTGQLYRVKEFEIYPVKRRVGGQEYPSERVSPLSCLS
jgi:hypothetical protein